MKKHCRLLDEYEKLSKTATQLPILDFISPAAWVRLNDDPRTEAARDKRAPLTSVEGAPQLVLFGGRVVVQRTRRS